MTHKLNFNEELEIQPLTKAAILSKVSEQQVYEYYLEESIYIGRRYSAPYRDNPGMSLSFTIANDGGLVWRDWGDTTVEKAQDVISFVMKACGNINFREALMRINVDLSLGLVPSMDMGVCGATTRVKDIPKRKKENRQIQTSLCS